MRQHRLCKRNAYGQHFAEHADESDGDAFDDLQRFIVVAVGDGGRRRDGGLVHRELWWDAGRVRHESQCQSVSHDAVLRAGPEHHDRLRQRRVCKCDAHGECPAGHTDESLGDAGDDL